MILGFFLGFGISLGFLSGIVGSFSIVCCIIFFAVLLCSGAFQIIPMIDMVELWIQKTFPSMKHTITEHVRKCYDVVVRDEKVKDSRPKLYLFHPHGVLATALNFHILTRMTDWPIRPMKAAILSKFLLYPFSREVFERIGAVPSDYGSMKGVLEGGESLGVSIGGSSEVKYAGSKKMTLICKSRRGIFKMALETGTPLVPVLVYGEDDVYEQTNATFVRYLNSLTESKGFHVNIPSLSSCHKMFQFFSGKKEVHVKTVLGSPLDVEKVDNPTEEDIERVRERYIEGLKLLYAETKPADYEEEITFV